MKPKHETIREAITAAFKQIKQVYGNDILARQNFWCCQSCGCAAVPESKKFYLFYHHQDNAAFDEYGDLKQGYSLYLAYGLTNRYDEELISRLGEDAARSTLIRFAQHIIKCLQDEGLQVTWDGRTITRIQVNGFVPKPEADTSYVELASK